MNTVIRPIDFITSSLAQRHFLTIEKKYVLIRLLIKFQYMYVCMYVCVYVCSVCPPITATTVVRCGKFSDDDMTAIYSNLLSECTLITSKSLSWIFRFIGYRRIINSNSNCAIGLRIFSKYVWLWCSFTLTEFKMWRLWHRDRLWCTSDQQRDEPTWHKSASQNEINMTCC